MPQAMILIKIRSLKSKLQTREWFTRRSSVKIHRKTPLQKKTHLSKNRHFGTGVFLWILRNFKEHFFYGTPLDDCFCDSDAVPNKHFDVLSKLFLGWFKTKFWIWPFIKKSKLRVKSEIIYLSFKQKLFQTDYAELKVLF